MSIHRDAFCGIRMTLETYDDDLALQAYVHQNYPHLMTALERRVTDYLAPITSDANDEKLRRLHAFLESRDGHVDDVDVYAAFKETRAERLAKAIGRVLRECRDQIFENRCSRCHRLARTMLAKQCVWCGFDWH